MCTSTLSRLNAANYLQKSSGVAGFSPLQTSISLADDVAFETVFYCTSSLRGYVASASADQLSGNMELSYCVWDDGQVFPPSPSAEGGLCKNAVIDVKYDMEYNGTALQRVVATYIMADIPFTTPDTLNYSRSFYEVNSTNSTLPSSGTSASNQSASLPVTIQTIPMSSDSYSLSSAEFVARVESRPVVVTTKYAVKYTSAEAPDPVKYSGRPGDNSFPVIRQTTLNCFLLQCSK